MKNHLIAIGILTILICVEFSGCNQISNVFLKDEDKLVGKWNSEEIWSSEAVWSNLPTIFEFFSNGTFQIKITLGTIDFSFTNGEWEMNDGILTTVMEDVIPTTDLSYQFSDDNTVLTLTDPVNNESYILRKQQGN